jgi:hypothetical protein
MSIDSVHDDLYEDIQASAHSLYFSYIKSVAGKAQGQTMSKLDDWDYWVMLATLKNLEEKGWVGETISHWPR